MNKMKWGIPVILLVLGAGVSLFFRKGGNEEEESPADSGEEDQTPRNVADEERRKIMSELGKKGAKRSAEVRRAKKKAKENDE